MGKLSENGRYLLLESYSGENIFVCQLLIYNCANNVSVGMALPKFGQTMSILE